MTCTIRSSFSGRSPAFYEVGVMLFRGNSSVQL
jgi:hypothetical protein